jgi:aspartyl-tRNA(Asn)/glutamyl-tRNA(Gln) amidotransferase subunit A
MSMVEKSILELGADLRSGAVTSEQITVDALQRIATHDKNLHAFITVTSDRALEDARRADQELRAGTDRGPLHGIPYGLKDIYDTAGIRTTCHSKLLIDNVPAADSAVAEKFRASGGVLLGKLATNEFAYGGPSFDLPFPLALNPWNLGHYTGGSSAGSAAAIAAGFLRLASGSDTGGSIRIPAAWCGTVGMKPTYGLVSRRGVFPLSWTLDHCGPLARSVEDAAVGLQVMAGHDPEDPASADVPRVDYLAFLNDGVAGLRIGVPRNFFADVPGADPEELAAIDSSIAMLRERGAIVEDVVLPPFALFAASCRVLLMGEGYAVHQENAKQRLSDYGEVTAGRLIIGATLSAVDYINAQRVRRELVESVNGVLRRYHALVTAMVLQTAPPLDDIANPMGTSSPIQTTPFNVTGHPALSLPVGLSTHRLPLAVQIVGRPFDEATVFRIARQLERDSGWLSTPLPVLSA